MSYVYYDYADDYYLDYDYTDLEDDIEEYNSPENDWDRLDYDDFDEDEFNLQITYEAMILTPNRYEALANAAGYLEY